MKLSTYFLFHYIYIITFYFIKSNENVINEPSLISYHLLDDKNVLITKNKIYFYNRDMKKTSEFNLLKNNDNNKSILVSQYSDDRYILILIKNILHIFDSNDNFLNSLFIETSNEWQYSDITPYKTYGNNLYFIITSIGSNSFILNKCNYNLINKEIEITKRNVSSSRNQNISGINCLFMQSDTNYINNTFTCFYIEYKNIISRSFSPENNFIELINLKYIKNIANINCTKFHMIVRTNENKQKALIYIVLNGIPFWLTFDFMNKFSEIHQINLNNFSVLENYDHKILYFKETKEFLVISQNINCELLITIFDDNFKLKSKRIHSFSNNNCSNNILYSVSFDGKDYQIKSEKGAKKSNELTSLYNKRYLEYDNIKCQTMDEESSKYDLCTSCNNGDNYYEAEFDGGTTENITIPEGMVECYSNETKPNNFYFDSNDRKFKLCYETCETCDKGGDGEENNCLTCAVNHMKRPDTSDSNNCVTKCIYSYYYTPYGYYKCNNSSNCPKDANLYIEDLKKCTDDCRKEKGYENQYGGQCYKDCPLYTTAINNICQDINIDSCTKTETQIDLETFLTGDGVNINAKTYSKEFNYTNKHVSLFYNNIYSILIYKDTNCINELNINLPKIDFGSCYSKLQKNITTNKKLIIALIEKFNGKGQKSSVTFYFYHPETGEKLDSENICKDEEIVIKQNIISQLNNSDSSVDIESAIYLTRQNIDIFNLSNEFYTDICYRFESPNGKDVPYQDRIHYYYPNLTLCELGCVSQGVNFTTMESICQCKINEVMNNELISGNALIKNAIGEVADLLSSSNLLVITCFKGVFSSETITKSVGGFIIIGIFILEIILVIIFLAKDIKFIRRYLYNLTQYYLVYSSDKNVNNVGDKITSLITTNEKNYKASLKNPPKKIKKSKLKENILIYSNNTNKIEDYSKTLKVLKNDSDKSLMPRNRHKKTTRAIILSNNDSLEMKKRRNSALLKAKANCGNIDLEEYLKPELDDMDYEDAIKLDKRNFFEYFSCRLKQKQIIMETFFYKENIKPLSIKALLLLLNINLYFVINGLFFNETYIEKIYNANDDEEHFFSYLSRSFNNFIYATLVSFIINIIIDCIFIEEKKIKRIFLREKDDQLQLKYEISMNMSNIKKRYTSFIFICLFICVISWYYLSCFNYVYPGVRLEWVKSSFTIIIIMQSISVLVRLLEAILRSISFQCKSEKIYKVKQLIA